MTDQHDPRYLSLISDVFEGLKEYYEAYLSDDEIRARLTAQSVVYYRGTDDIQADYVVLRDGVERKLDEIDLEHAEASGMSFNDIVAEIEEHEASELVMFDRNAVNGFVTFKFYDRAGHLAGKLTFDSVEDDMVGRAKAVLDRLSNAAHSFQNEVERIWDSYDADAETSMRI